MNPSGTLMYTQESCQQQNKLEPIPLKSSKSSTFKSSLFVGFFRWYANVKLLIDYSLSDHTSKPSCGQLISPAPLMFMKSVKSPRRVNKVWLGVLAGRSWTWPSAFDRWVMSGASPSTFHGQTFCWFLPALWFSC